MVLRKVSLGQNVLRSTDAALQARSSTTAFLTSVRNGFNSRPPTLIACEDLIASIPSKLDWICAGLEWALEISIHIDNDLPCEGMATIGEAVGDMVKASKIWQQLHLEAVALRVESNGGSQSTKTTIIFGHAESDVDLPKRACHKLGANASHHDVRPPAGTPSHELETVRVDIVLEPTPSDSKPRRKQPATEKTGGTMVGDIGLATTDSDDTFRSLFGDTPCRSSSTRECVEVSERFNKLQSSTDSLQADLLGETQLSTRPTDHEHRDGNAACDQRLSPRTVLRVHVLGLIAVALRLSISPFPPRFAKHFKLLETHSVQYLSDFAPAVFRLGHMPAVSSRSYFLPTLSHALARFRSSAVSSNLRTKLARLGHVECLDDTTLSSSFATTLKEQDRYMLPLWNVVDSKLGYPDQSRQLLPFRHEITRRDVYKVPDDEWALLQTSGLVSTVDREGSQAFDEILEYDDSYVLDYDSPPNDPTVCSSESKWSGSSGGTFKAIDDMDGIAKSGYYYPASLMLEDCIADEPVRTASETTEVAFFASCDAKRTTTSWEGSVDLLD